MKRRRGIAWLAALLVLAAASPAATEPRHGLSLFGDPLKYPPDFKHFDYVNPDAPKGGTVHFADVGTFDNLNPFILKGVSFVRYANSLMQAGALFDSLMTGSLDEPFTAYGLIAETVDFAADRRSMTFALRPEARFHDGTPITPRDVCWTFNTLITKGHPSFRVQLAEVDNCAVLDAHRVKFTFKGPADRDLPLEVATLPVLPEHWWKDRDFAQPTLDPPLGNGPYRIAAVDPGRSITWERVKDYWAKDLPVNLGTANFDTVQVDYYRDTSVMFEAFKAGQIDLREENTAKDWATAYDFPAIKEGLVARDEVHHEVPTGMQSFAFNLRRPIFQDRRVRQAMGYLFDFEWENKNFFYGSYQRTKSYWENSDLAARGLPKGEELKLLEAYRGRIPDEIFTTPYEPPAYDGTGNIRDGIRAALRLFKAAGWSVKDGKLVNEKTGQPFTFEYLNDEPRTERVILPFLKNLEKVGIFAQIRNVDVAQFENRRREYDFDMMGKFFSASLAPGIGLRELYGSAAADRSGSPNLNGIKDKVVDELIEKAIAVKTRAELVPIIHALDRVLLFGYYDIPNWYAGFYRVAYWKKFGRPATQPKYANMPSAVIGDWWIDPSSEAAQSQQRPSPAPPSH